MNTCSISGSAMLLSVLLSGGSVFAGGLSTSGQGARALGMAGAFTAVADDGSAVFYNPAGIAQIDGSTIQVGLAFISPRLEYTTPTDAIEISTKKALAPSLFITHQITQRLSAGLGVFAPYARDAEFADDLVNGFAMLRSKIVRTDLSGVVSYQMSDAFSIGAGLLVGYSELDRSIPAGPYLRINDRVDGVGVGGTVGFLWQANEHIKVGITYRTEMLIDHDGDRSLLAGGLTTTSNARAELRYPASLVLGMAVSPSEHLTLALDVNWTGWNSLDQVTTRTDVWPDSITSLNGSDSRDIRIGIEYRLPTGWAVRSGYAYGQGAFPATHVIPAQPDADGHEIGLGVSKTTGSWRLDLAYQYTVTDEIEATANTFGYNGKYTINQQLLGLTAAYRF